MNLLSGKSRRRGLRHGRRGVTLIELTGALVIGAVLSLAAVFATDVALRSYATNVRSTEQHGRWRAALHRLASETRSGSDHRPGTAALVSAFSSGASVTDTTYRFVNTSGATVVIAYNSAARTLTMQVGTGAANVLLSDVESFSVVLNPTRSAAALRAGTGCDMIASARLSVSMRETGTAGALRADASGQLVRITTSVVPRDNLWN